MIPTPVGRLGGRRLRRYVPGLSRALNNQPSSKLRARRTVVIGGRLMSGRDAAICFVDTSQRRVHPDCIGRVKGDAYWQRCNGSDPCPLSTSAANRLLAPTNHPLTAPQNLGLQPPASPPKLSRPNSDTTHWGLGTYRPVAAAAASSTSVSVLKQPSTTCFLLSCSLLQQHRRHNLRP